MIMAPPIIKLDELEQLVQTDMKIVANTRSTLASFAKLETPELIELARIVEEKLDKYELNQWENVSRRLGSQLRNGSRAYHEFKFSIIFDMIKIVQFENIDQNEPKLTDLLHISEERRRF